MLLFLFPYKFTDSFNQRHQIDILKKKLNTKIEIHDLSNILNKEWNKAFLNKRHKTARVYNSVNEWENYIKKLYLKEKKIFVVNLLDRNSFNSVRIHKILNNNKIQLLQFCSPEVCIKKNKQKAYFIKKILKFFQILFSNPNRLFFLIKTKIFSEMINLIKYENLFIFYTGKKKFMKPSLNSKNKKFITFNSQDYSNYLLDKTKQNKKKNYILFLDAPTPYFLGDKQLFKYKIKYNTKKWYKDLNNFLSQIENKFNSKIIIIPHPRVMKFKNPYYDKKFEVRTDIGATSKLIPKSKFVIAISCTMAVSYCVLNYKKILLIYNNQIVQQNPNMMSNLTFMSKVLKINLFNLNRKIEKNKLLNPVNKKVYDNYKFNYLTSKKVINKMNFKIFNSFLNNRITKETYGN